MKCRVCNKEIPKDVYMHACHYAARRHQPVEHLELAFELLKKEKEATLSKLMEEVNGRSQKVVDGEAGDGAGGHGGEVGNGGENLEHTIDRILAGRQTKGK